MGILSRQAIASRLEAGQISIVPAPAEEDYDSDAVNVHLGDNVYEWVPAPAGSVVSVALWKPPPGDFRYSEFSTRFLRDVPPDNAGIITLRPHSFYLADLREHTSLPADVAMHVNGKSSLARLGVLVHLTAPHAHAGWSGRLTLEIYNLGPFNIEMKPGMTIAQLTFWRVDEPEAAHSIPRGQFSDQSTARGS